MPPRLPLRATRQAAGKNGSTKKTRTVAAVGDGPSFKRAKPHLKSATRSGVTPVAVCDPACAIAARREPAAAA